MHWFSDLGSRQTHRPPLAFLLKASALTQSVGSVMEVITPRSSIFSSSVLISSRSWMGYFCGGCTIGWASSWRVMWSSPSKSPIPLNLSGYRRLRSMALWTGWAAGDVAVWTMQCIVISRSCLLLGSPRITGPSDSVTKKSELCHSVSICLQERVMTPSCFIVVLLYACGMVCLFFVVPPAGYPLGASFLGNI